jgi:hypothetical protein
MTTCTPKNGSGLKVLTITVENLAPPMGTVVTPLWFGFHDGSFTIYRDGAPASAALERLAEDANAGPISNRFNQAGVGISQGIVFGSDDILNSIFPGSTASAKVLLDCSLTSSHYFSYAAMIVPSNDAFIGNECPTECRIVDEYGQFVGADIIVMGSEVRDAGTEVNDEALFHAAGAGPVFLFDAGVRENGIVHTHEGYQAGGTILSNPAFANADFKAEGYRIARITVKEA